MIITESFVWINFPKTGSTFAREVFRRLYSLPLLDRGKRRRFHGRWMREELVPETRPRVGERFGQPSPHGRVSQIPESFRGLPVVSALRDPVKRAYSLHSYGDWKKADQFPVPVAEIVAAFPEFPDLSFENYLDYIRHFGRKNCIKVGERLYALGSQSVDFVSFFANSTDPKLCPPSFESWESLADQLARVHFLDVDDLSAKLAAFLQASGFAEKDLEFIVTMPRINESAGLSAERGMPSSIQDGIRESEWLMELYHGKKAVPSASELRLRAQPLRVPH